MDSLWVVPKIVYGGRLKRQTAMGWELCTSLLHSLPHTHVNSKGNRPTNLRKATVPNECPQSIESLLWMAWSTLASFQHSTWGQTHMRYSKTHPRTKFSSFFFFNWLFSLGKYTTSPWSAKHEDWIQTQRAGTIAWSNVLFNQLSFSGYQASVL